MKDKRRKGGFFGLLLYFSFLLIGCSHFSPTQTATQPVVQSQPTPAPSVSDNRRWRSATYRGLEVGKSTRQDMLRVLGKPKLSNILQPRITTNPNIIVAYQYGGPPGYGGNLMVGVEKTSNVIAWIETNPEPSSEEDVIRQFGSDYVMTSYDGDHCFVDGQPHYYLYETSANTETFLTRMEYRQLGVAVQFRLKEVYRIDYISDKWPYGNSASLCGQPQKGLAYIACGCGCCGGVEPRRQCLYRSKGDNLEAIIQKDKEQQKSAICANVGCALGTKYVYCD